MDFDEREPEKKDECGHVRERVQFWPPLFAAVAPHYFSGSSSCVPRGKEQLLPCKVVCLFSQSDMRSF